MSSVDKSPSSPAENPSLLTGRNWIERLLVSFIASHTPKCREIVRLLSQSMEVKLPITTRIRIRTPQTRSESARSVRTRTENGQNIAEASKIRVLIADDHSVVLEGLAAIIGRQAD